MEKLTQKIIDYINSKYTYNYKKWNIGFTNNIKEIKKELKNKNEIVCEYFKSWPCKNKTQAKQILKEISPLGFNIYNKTPTLIIFVFLAIDKENYKAWKILNSQKRKDYLILK